MSYRLMMLASFLALTGTTLPAQQAQWVPDPGLNSAQLAVDGWTLIAAAGNQANPTTSLSVTFWQSPAGEVARCIFSIVTPTGAEIFETCAVAMTVQQ